jgi:Predicted nucleic acid-binding protein, contains PIN domain
MKRHLFDASSFVKALKLSKPELLIKSHIQWLTLYEIMNALRKETCLAKAIPVDKALQLMDIVTQIAKHMKILDISGLEVETLDTAIKLGLTAYDASYIALAKKHNLVLVTEDAELKIKAQQLVKTLSIGETSSHQDNNTS